MKVKILTVITKSNWGGAQRYVFDLMRSLPRDAFEPIVAAGGNGALFRKLEAEGIRAVPVHSFERNISLIKEVRAFFELLSLYRTERPHVIHLNSSKAGGLGAAAAWIYGWLPGANVKTIFTVHGWAFNEPRPFWQRAAIRVLSFVTALLVDRVICISTADAYDAARFVPQKKIDFIPNGIHAPTYPTRERARELFRTKTGHDLPTDRPIIGVIAEYTKNKGYRYFLRALADLKESGFQFYAVCIGGGEEEKILRDAITSMGLESHVLLAGYVENAHDTLPIFDLFVLPSLKEGLPYTILEAMAARVPVVATAVGGIPDLIEHEKTGLLAPPRDAQALARTMARALEKDARTFASDAHERFITSFTLEGMLRRTIHAYEA